MFFHGEYQPTDRYIFVRSTDILHNVYIGDNEMKALSNKYYDGAIFRLPQLCIRDSFMAKQSEAAGIGIGVNPFDPDFLDCVYAYYSQLDWASFNAACDREAERVLQEYEAGCRVIRSAIDLKERL